VGAPAEAKVFVPYLPSADRQLALCDRYGLAVAQDHGQQMGVGILRLLSSPVENMGGEVEVQVAWRGTKRQPTCILWFRV